MEPLQKWTSWQPSAFTAVVALVILLFLIAVMGKPRKRRLPGPRGWPVLGCIPLLGPLPHRSLARLAKKHGPLLFMKLGSLNTVVVSSPKLAEEFLKSHDKVWASRHATAAVKILTYDARDIAFSEYGPRWRYARKVFLLELLTAKRLSDFRKIRKEEIVRGINDAIERCSGGTKPVRMDLILGKIALNVATRMLTNEGCLNDKANTIKNSEDYQEKIREAFALFRAFYIGDYIPWLDRFDPQRLKKRMYALSRQHDEFLQNILDDHKMKLEAAKTRPQGTTDDTMQDIVYTLLTRPRDVDGQYLDESETKAVMQDMILGATETSSRTIEWGLSELLKNPHVLQRAQAEMYSAVGRERLVEESDIPNLPYLNAIVKETFRLHPAGPFIQRMSTEDCEIEGYRIPAKTKLIVNIHAIQRDPEVYDRALDFYPERFLGSEKDVHGLTFDLLPFGTGRRICPGKGLGLLLLHYTMALFIQTCNLSLPGDKLKPEQLDMEEKFGITTSRRTPLEAVLVSALPSYLLRESQSIPPESAMDPVQL